MYTELGKTLEGDEYYYSKLLEQTYIVVANEKYILSQLIGESGVFNSVNIQEYFDLIEYLSNVYFVRLGCKKLPFDISESKLYSWFVSTSVGYAEVDFFGKGIGKEYETAWNEHGFGKVWGAN